MSNTAKRFLKQQPWFRRIRLANIERRTLKHGYPDWPQIIGDDWPRWTGAVRISGSAGRVLIATSVGAHLPSAALDSLLGVALTLRGAQVHVLLCDSTLPACMRCEVELFQSQAAFAAEGPQSELCRVCFEPAAAMFRRLGFHVHKYRDFLTGEDLEKAKQLSTSIAQDQIANFEMGACKVGQHAVAGALRFYARGDFAGESHAEPILRRFFEASILTALATDQLFSNHHFDSVVLHHGIYVPQGNIVDVANDHQVRVVTWHQAYRAKTFIFSADDTYHHTMIKEPASEWEYLAWTAVLDKRIGDYLHSRISGKQDWIGFQKDPVFDVDNYAKKVGLDPAKPWVLLLTNVVWDAQLHFAANAFGSMMEWVCQTTEYFRNRQDLQLIIRVHPAEVLGSLPSRQRVEDELIARFPVLPPNVFIVAPTSPLSTYALAERCDTTLIYGTKTGVELASRGIPVICAGEAWVRGKDITADVSSPGDYFDALRRLPSGRRLSSKITERARKYAYHFFFRRMIPIGVVEPAAGWPPFSINARGLVSLGPGGDAGLDVVCSGILDGQPFVFRDELNSYAPQPGS